MNNKISYKNIYHGEYVKLAKIMTSAFNKDT